MLPGRARPGWSRADSGRGPPPGSRSGGSAVRMPRGGVAANVPTRGPGRVTRSTAVEGRRPGVRWRARAQPCRPTGRACPGPPGRGRRQAAPGSALPPGDRGAAGQPQARPSCFSIRWGATSAATGHRQPATAGPLRGHCARPRSPCARRAGGRRPGPWCPRSVGRTPTTPRTDRRRGRTPPGSPAAQAAPGSRSRSRRPAPWRRARPSCSLVARRPNAWRRTPRRRSDPRRPRVRRSRPGSGAAQGVVA